MKERRFTKGAKILFPEHAIAEILDGRWLFWGYKPYHPGWAVSWSIHTIRRAVWRGDLFLAIDAQEDND